MVNTFGAPKPLTYPADLVEKLGLLANVGNKVFSACKLLVVSLFKPGNV